MELLQISINLAVLFVINLNKLNYKMKKVFTICALATTVLFSACKREDKDDTVVTVDYTTSYSNFIKNAAGDTTTDRTAGRKLNKMFAGELVTYMRKSTSQAINSSDMKNMFAGSGFSDATLNSSGLQIKANVASSFPSADADKIRAKFESYFDSLANISTSFADSAKEGKAGIAYNVTTKYLCDAKGIEWIQIIQKGLIGAFQLDYIGNVLLANTNVDNTTILSGTKQTQLAQNWDRAYGLLTTKNIYGSSASSTIHGESQLGAYAWEYNPYNPSTKKALDDIHSAFVKGRIAVQNNDLNAAKTQADIIRLTYEKTLAKSALGYIVKTKDKTTSVGARIHAFGEGLGFIYSLRFCKLSEADATFADDIFNDFVNTGFYKLTDKQLDDAATKIKTKFNL